MCIQMLKKLGRRAIPFTIWIAPVEETFHWPVDASLAVFSSLSTSSLELASVIVIATRENSARYDSLQCPVSCSCEHDPTRWALGFNLCMASLTE
mmetsp:Transcript_30624/g.59938  ORF Transcript_30624/g.59938 Transcript_30624/m.59938 type:complete len:95 (+) Transcript_30624:268-552(+)